jgi:hypothetical protein
MTKELEKKIEDNKDNLDVGDMIKQAHKAL